MRKGLRFIALIILVLVALACGSGGKSGSVSGTSQRCYIQGASGNCEGSFTQLKGTYSLEIENEHINSEEVFVTLQAYVKEGALRVYIDDGRQNITSVDNLPDGKPHALSLFGPASFSGSTFKVYFEAPDGKAGGITYHIDYVMP